MEDKQVEYRCFVAQDDYVKYFRDKDEVVPPFLVFQPYIIRDGIEGYMLLCDKDYPGAEEWSCES